LRGADLIEKAPALKNELLKYMDIYGVSYCASIIGKSISTSINYSDGNDKPTIEYQAIDADKDFIKVMGIELISGMDFTGDTPEDFIVNETLSKKLGWNDIGESYLPMFNPGKLIGVVKDFHFNSLYNPINSFMIRRFRGTELQLSIMREGTLDEKRASLYGFLVLNISATNTSKTIKYVEDKYNEFDSKHPFEFEFLDDVLNKMYLSEQNLMKLIGIFASVCIFISCLGLFGLTAFSTEQRTKEIGTRKVLGASTWQIITMFSKRILLLVLVGAVFASLAAGYVMDEWLTRFAYKIDIELWVFFVSAAVVGLLAFIAVAAQAFRAAQADPVKALRYE
jgi:putative ABC transport system permease protein